MTDAFKTLIKKRSSYKSKTDIEVLEEESSAVFTECEDFECQYFSLLALARSLLGSTSAQVPGSETSFENATSALACVTSATGKKYKVRLLLDNGSTGNFVTEQLSDLLGFSRRGTSTKVKSKWHTSKGKLKICSLVLIKDKTTPPLLWPMGWVIQVYPSVDGVSMVAEMKTKRVGSNVSSTTMLVDYLRNVLNLRGTKYMCREGGCGACIVTVVKSPDAQPISVNSCLVSITSCEGWDITTVENVGNKLQGYHKVQKTLAEHNGTQCGHCSPGWIMSMYSLLQQKKGLTKLEIEKSFGSNICRCTGYRPILEAFKTFANDSTVAILDIEDLNICNKSGKKCKKESCSEDDWCFLSKDDVDPPNKINIKLKDRKLWFTVSTVKDIFDVLKQEGDDSYMLVAGNTGKGAYHILEYPNILIDISNVSELKGYTIDQNLILGAGNTLTEVLEIFEDLAKSNENFTYLSKLRDHISLVAHIPVRNIGSLAGNLMIKHQHNDFPSDIYLLLQTVGAELSILSEDNAQTVSMEDFLKLDMKAKVISKVYFPPLNDECHIVTLKIMPRSESAHAIVNAGFFYKYKSNTNVLQARIVIGGLSPSFTRAYETEKYLVGKSLFTNKTLQDALKVLEKELVVTPMPPEPSVEYRKKLALGLFYKGLLILYPEDKLPSQYKSGTIKLHESRPVSNAKQTYDTNPELWPLNKPTPKLEALIQCSGEADYTEDIPSLPREVFAAFVLATVPNGKIENVDANKALKVSGVMAFYTAKDIPGTNSFTPVGIYGLRINEEMLANEQVKYYNQPIGIIVAESRALAEYASKLVEVKYSGTTKPVVDLKAAINEEERIHAYGALIATNRGFDIAKIIKGKNYINEQYHMTMETLVCVTRPTSQGIEVHSSTQWPDGVQAMISRALNMDENKIDVYVPRVGGAYGIKISRSILSAAACSLVTSKLNRPCRFIQSLTTNTKAVGKRCSCITDYEVGVNSLGVIQYNNYNMYESQGYIRNEQLSALTLDSFHNCYFMERWNFKVNEVITDTAKTTWCRAPGTFQAIGMAELLMEHISYELSLDPVEVRLANLDILLHSSVKEMFETLKSDSDYDKRRKEVEKFNKNNRWKKRGLRTSFLKWSSLAGQLIDVNVVIYHDDGTVVITHGGIEIGQGINTLAAQVCAYILKIDLNKIQVKGNSTINVANGDPTGGSLTSSNVMIGVEKCCNKLVARLSPIKAVTVDPTWEKVIKAAYNLGVDLHAHSYVRRTDNPSYSIHGVAFAEVEIDVLTGESEVLRVDLLEDVGRSVNPDVDIGQVEGAFIMGQGCWTTENIVYDEDTGENLSDRTWNYYVPLSRDIPQDFRVNLKKKSFGKEILLGSKVVGEPPICLSVVVPLAIREAIVAARLDCGIPTNKWFPQDGPLTTEKICLLSETKIEDFKFC